MTDLNDLRWFFYFLESPSVTPNIMTPLTTEKLIKSEQQATPHEIRAYQQIFRSILYAAVTARPDVAFAVSLLGTFSKNPSEVHLARDKRLDQYLYNTRFSFCIRR